MTSISEPIFSSIASSEGKACGILRSVATFCALFGDAIATGSNCG